MEYKNQTQEDNNQVHRWSMKRLRRSFFFWLLWCVLTLASKRGKTTILSLPPKNRSDLPAISSAIFWRFFQRPLNGGVSNGGVSRSGLVLPFLPFLGLSRFFRDFPDLLGDSPGIFPICPFPLSQPINRNNPERVRDTIWTFPEKSGKPPGLETPRFSFSQFPVSPYPLNLRGEDSPPKFRGRPSKNTLKLGGFRHSAPKFRGRIFTF